MKFEDMINKVIQGDCLEVMKDIPDKSIDLILTDPPYGIGIGKMSFANDNGTKKVGKAYRNNYIGTSWDIPLDVKYFNEMKRISKNQIIFGGNYYSILGDTKGFIIWDKRTDEKYNNDFADCEFAWTSFDKPARLFRYLWSGMLQGNMKDKEQRYHPTQKPLPLFKWIISNYTNQTDIILDCFLGSGTTAVAAKELDRRFIGIELSKEYCDIANERLRILDMQPRLL